MKSRLATLLFASALAAGLLIPAMSSEALATTHAATAPAAPCSGFGCDGYDPNADGCATGATVPTSVTNSYGTLQLRWSPTCKTNWGRLITSRNVGPVLVRVIREAPFKVCGDQPGNGCNDYWYNSPSTIYSNQLYGCNYTTYAEAFIYNSNYIFTTPAVGGC